MLNQSSRALSWILALSLVAVACGDDDDTSDTATGGGGGKGGAASGGKSATTGGKSATTGGSNAGGSSGKGGGPTTGGSPTTGGQATGGEPQGGAGAGGDGGAPMGGMDPGTGGTAGAGGTPPEGGSAGSAGSPEGGWSGGGVGGSAMGGAGGYGGSGATGEGGADEGGAAGAGGAPIVADMIDNPGFELGNNGLTPPPGWATSGPNPTAAYTRHDSNADRGDDPLKWGFLNIWANTAYEVTISQVVTPLPPGTYSLSVWQLGIAYAEQYVFVRGHDLANPTAMLKVNTAPSPWGTYAERVIPAIVVTSGQVEIGIYSRSTLGDAAGDWSQFDDFTLTRLP